MTIHLATPGLLALSVGAVFAAGTLSGDTTVPIACALAVCFAVWRASAKLQKHVDVLEGHDVRLTAIEASVKQLGDERRLDFDFLRAEMAGIDQGPVTGARRYRVLLVEDNATDRMLFRRKLDSV